MASFVTQFAFCCDHYTVRSFYLCPEHCSPLNVPAEIGFLLDTAAVLGAAIEHPVIQFSKLSANLEVLSTAVVLNISLWCHRVCQ
jgi:hypothetical protein